MFGELYQGKKKGRGNEFRSKKFIGRNFLTHRRGTSLWCNGASLSALPALD